MASQKFAKRARRANSNNDARMVTIVDWVQRCGAAQEAGSPFPEASLLRAVVDHAEWSVSADHQDAYTAGAAPSGLKEMSGLELATALPAGGLLRLHHAPGAPPLTLGPPLVAHLQLFVQIRVVENILSHLQRGAALPLSQPCARLRDFDSYWVVQQGALLALAPDVQRRRLVRARAWLTLTLALTLTLTRTRPRRLQRRIACSSSSPLSRLVRALPKSSLPRGLAVPSSSGGSPRRTSKASFSTRLAQGHPCLSRRLSLRTS